MNEASQGDPAVPHRALLDALPVGVVAIDGRGRVAYANAEAGAALGYGTGDLLGRPVAGFLGDGRRGGCARDPAAWQGHPPEPHPAWHRLRLRVKGGRGYVAEVGLRPFATAEGGLLIAVLQDVSGPRQETRGLRRARAETEARLQQRSLELEAANEALARSNADLERFASVASHDLQEPLRMVEQYAALIAERCKDCLDEKGHRFLGHLVDGAHRMRAMIRGILAVSRVSIHGGALERVSLPPLVARVLEDLRPAIEEGGAEVTVGSLPTVRADPTQLVEVFQNLIGNALKFHGPAPPRVRVEAARGEGGWVIHVRDQGIGIDPADAERVFGMFQRLQDRARHPGSGMGLAIVRRIVERHGGRVWLDSMPGEGATFSFSLPDDRVGAEGARRAAGLIDLVGPPRAGEGGQEMSCRDAIDRHGS